MIDKYHVSKQANQMLNKKKYQKQLLFLFCYCFVVFLFAGKMVYCQELQEKFQDWSVFKIKKDNRIICYTMSLPINSNGNYIERGEPFFYVVNIEDDADEISVSSGVIYDQKIDVELSFGSKKFYLFPYKSLAWANDKNDDIDIIKEMQKGEEMSVNAISQDGKTSSDTYSLIGFSQSYKKLKNICNNSKK